MAGRRRGGAAILTLLTSLALAAPGTGYVAMSLSPEAEVRQLPRVEPDRIDVVVLHNRLPLTRDASTRYLEHLDVMSVGGGTWFVTFFVDRDDIELSWQADDDLRTLFVLQQGSPAISLPPGTPTVQDIVDGNVTRRPAPPPALGLRPLFGDATTIAPPVDAWELPLPVSLPDASWTDIEDARRRVGSDPAANWQLGAGHLALGLPREALYYLSRAETAPGPPGSLQLLRARASMMAGRVDQARGHCSEAWHAGAGDSFVLECLGLVSLETSDPAPAAVGRALAKLDEPRTTLLAALLLQRDNQFAESRAVLEGRDFDDHLQKRLARAALGDALFAARKTDEALAIWQIAGWQGELGALVDLRERIAHMSKDGPATWARHVPDLEQLAEKEGPVGAEALNLLAQVANHYGDAEHTATQLGRMWDRHRRRSLRSDVPERLMEACERRTQQLYGQTRRAEGAAFFESCWRPGLDRFVSDTTRHETVVDTLAELGLPQRALALQLRVLEVHTTAGQDDPAALVRLARLYVETERPQEALDTLDYLRSSRIRAEGQDAVEAEAWYAMGELDKAAAAWLRAGDRRRRALVRAEQGRCKEALPELARHDDDDVHLARARCMVDLGKDLDGYELAARVKGDEADWIARVAAARAGLPHETDDPLWSSVMKEEAAVKELLERLDE